MPDRRVTPFRADLAAMHLQGIIDAPRYAQGVKRSVCWGCIPLKVHPSDDAAQDSELLFGENFTVYDSADGWCWGQAESDGYVGYVREGALTDSFVAQHRIMALEAPALVGPDLKHAVQDILPMNAGVHVLDRIGQYVEIERGVFLHEKHIAPLEAQDFVTLAEQFIGAAYVWGGKTYAGVDCSGLIQMALLAVGISCPRDTDMQERELGVAVPQPERRGDLVFWRGHVGVMLDQTRLLHATAWHMQTMIEPLEDVKSRIFETMGPVTSVKRL